ncbi:hypothetical protein BH11GEM1_BH11GEM1_19980 [soil metagenome]
MRMPFVRTAAVLTLAFAIAPVRMQAQHVMVQAIPFVTRADPTAGASAGSQRAVSQALVMARVGFWHERGAIATTLDAEGLTIPNGELDTGAYGEGFVDRRHPHTYVHELMLTGGQTIRAVTYSASAGRGFAPFGTDDPMMRPIEKFPVNHHLSPVASQRFSEENELNGLEIRV